MSRQLPIGSIVQLEKGDTKLMIINRFPLYNNDGKIGYFDYSACLYPKGTTDNQAYFFNEENVEKVWFEGYIDESEEEAQKTFEERLKAITVPHFKISDIN